jgi:4-amino-4-deoxy-L-arabinose transferase-like glycosyltransferase
MTNLRALFSKSAQAVAGIVHRIPLVWWIALLVGLLHLVVAGRYDIFRNELYFIDCGRHPDFGYVDQPPLIPLLAAATQLFGDNVWLLRIPGVIAAAALVPLTASFSRLLGGNERSALIAGAAAGLAPALAALTSVLTTATLEPIAWTALAYLLTRALVQHSAWALLGAGAVAGVAMEAKYGIAIWTIALALGAAVSPIRRLLLWRPFWLAICLATVIAAPSLIWPQAHGWPFREVHARHLAEGTNFTGTPLQFERQQVWAMNILLAPLWISLNRNAVSPPVVKASALSFDWFRCRDRTCLCYPRKGLLSFPGLSDNVRCWRRRLGYSLPLAANRLAGHSNRDFRFGCTCRPSDS